MSKVPQFILIFQIIIGIIIYINSPKLIRAKLLNWHPAFYSTFYPTASYAVGQVVSLNIRETGCPTKFYLSIRNWIA